MEVSKPPFDHYPLGLLRALRSGACALVVFALAACEQDYNLRAATVSTPNATGVVTENGSGGVVVVSGSESSTAVAASSDFPAATSEGSSSSFSAAANSLSRQSLASPGDTDAEVEAELLNGVLGKADTCGSYKITAPRGVSCMHCMIPKAKAQSDLLVRVLMDSCLQNPSITYLVDGSFDFNEARLYRHVAALTKNGRTPHLVFYLSNGPSQRRWQSTPVQGLATQIPPEEFRKLIGYDPAIREQVKQVVGRVLPVTTFAVNRGAVVSYVVMLEDNLDADSFTKFAELVLEEVPPGLPVSIGRNPCPTCYAGNDAEVPLGYFTELHQTRPSVSISDGVISNDGTDYVVGGSTEGRKAVTLESLRELRDTANAKNNIFILWSAKYQGLNSWGPSLGGFEKAPAARRYATPTVNELSALEKFLAD